MNIDELKRHLVDICHCASERWLTAGSGGNISVRIPDTDRYLCTAPGVTVRDTAVENIVEMDLAGKQISPGPWKPSKEHRWHAGILQIRPEVHGVVHTHSTATMAFGDAQCFAERGRLLRLLLELASRPAPAGRPAGGDRGALTAAFLDRVNPDERARARELLDLARSSYRLRDDDNLHLGAIKAQVLRATEEGRARLRRQGRDPDGDLEDGRLALALRDPNLQVEAPPRQQAIEPEPGFIVRPRQLVGQPAAPGIASGPARVLGAADSLFEVTAGDVIVCDAIDPNMTFVVPLASAVVERRGGMLIHGAIIAREYGLPCVTGIAGATTKIATGDRLTVDGFLGIVTVG